MVERMDDYNEEDTVSEKRRERAEQQEVLTSFIKRLQELSAAMLRIAHAEREPVESPSELASDTDVSGRLGQERQAQAEAVLSDIQNEGFTVRNIKEILGYLDVFNSAELLEIAALIGNLLLEWDPILHFLLRDAQEQLRTMARLKQVNEIRQHYEYF